MLGESTLHHLPADRTDLPHNSVAIGKVAAAYELGERHRDFESLVHLSNDPTHGSPLRIRSYLDQYRRDFAFPLYRFYLDQGAFCEASVGVGIDLLHLQASCGCCSSRKRHTALCSPLSLTRPATTVRRLPLPP